MKNRLLKILSTLTFSFAFIIGVACINVHASWEIIPSEDGNILKIHNEKPGGLFYEFRYKSGVRYKHIVIIGKMDDTDFTHLELISDRCKSIDISSVEISCIPPRRFCHNEHLEKFVCPTSLKTISMGCFIDCYSLETIILPESLQTIEYGSFSLSKNLKLKVPEKVTIEESVFCGCPNVDLSKCKQKQAPKKVNLIVSQGSDTPSIFQLFKSLFSK